MNLRFELIPVDRLPDREGVNYGVTQVFGLLDHWPCGHEQVVGALLPDIPLSERKPDGWRIFQARFYGFGPQPERQDGTWRTNPGYRLVKAAEELVRLARERVRERIEKGIQELKALREMHDELERWITRQELLRGDLQETTQALTTDEVHVVMIIDGVDKP